MEVVVPVPAAAVEFNFDNSCLSPYMTAPSSPQSFGSSFFFSAPSHPTRASSFAAVPFEWEEKPGVPKRKSFHGRIHKKDKTNNDDNGGGAVVVIGVKISISSSSLVESFERTPLSAEKLFHGGKIRPLKPPPGSSEFSSTVSSPKARAFRKNDVDPFQTAIEKSRKGSVLIEPKNTQPESILRSFFIIIFNLQQQVQLRS
ncbi:Serine carboxypeptidase-like 26 [Hibiscus syriacus]|uniref:Serine carboxypeptidase-like 26 n=1 Tax=Hibiscus syriacus TaxID=106335 RepID=A0A6A3A960_HIBSY|nr:Serine carboxypeptidase-like 26 [Hibiscus syriacus]